MTKKNYDETREHYVGLSGETVGQDRHEKHKKAQKRTLEIKKLIID